MPQQLSATVGETSGPVEYGKECQWKHKGLWSMGKVGRAIGVPCGYRYFMGSSIWTPTPLLNCGKPKIEN